MTKSEPLVAIRCIAYNQEAYIKDTLEGFVSQKTTFPFVAIVHDDASTDNTASIIREYSERYPDIIKPIYETENQYSKPGNPLGEIMKKAIETTGAKYVAYCEGDDYWIDQYKLQKQVDFLENNLEFGLCYTKIRQYIQEKNKFTKTWGGSGESFESLINLNTIPTLTVVMRFNIYTQYLNQIHPETKNWLMGDYPCWLYFAANSKIKFFNEVTGIYRVLKNSASHSTDDIRNIKFLCSNCEIKEYFLNKYKGLVDYRLKLKYKLLQFELDFLLKKFSSKYEISLRRSEIKSLLKYNRFNSDYFKSLLIIVFPKFGLRLIKILRGI